MNDQHDDIADNRQIDLPAEGETDLDDTANASHQPEEPRIYQDDLDYKDSDTDPITEELTDNPAEVFGIPEAEFKQELDKYAGDGEPEDDDMREAIEDMDEDGDDPTAGA